MAVNHAAEATYASSTALQDGFRRAQAQSQMLAQKNLDGQALAGEDSGVATQRHSVIHPAQAGAHPRSTRQSGGGATARAKSCRLMRGKSADVEFAIPVVARLAAEKAAALSSATGAPRPLRLA